MKNLLFITLLFFFGCAAKHNTSPCNENLAFKDEFFKHVTTVENITFGTDRRGNFLESLKFISQYAPVSYNKIANYKIGYDSESFKADKARWLKWYEENKCNNIQFKKL